MGASVWIMPVNARLFGAVVLRFSPETMPAVNEPARPNGAPIASAVSPTCRVSEFPMARGWSWSADTETLTTARSALWSTPFTCPVAVCPSLNVTWICVAPDTTWAFVRMSPCLSTTIPEPSAWLNERAPPRAMAVEIMTTPGAVC